MNSFNNMKKIINAIISNKKSKCNNLNNNNNNYNNNNYNRLLRLPIDLTNNISLYLNEQVQTSAGDASPHIKKIKRQFEKAQIVGGHDKWLCSMFKSIKTLEVFFDGSPLLPQLPVELMFDPIKSNLERFEMRFGYDNNIFQHFDQFAQKYITLKEKRVLKYVRLDEPYGKGRGILNKLFCIESIYVELYEPSARLISKDDDINDNSNVGVHSKLRTVTFNRGCDIDFENENKNEKDRNYKNSYKNRYTYTSQLMNTYTHEWNIETLRFINIKCRHNIKLLHDEKLIEFLNLHNTVKQLTLNVIFGTSHDTVTLQRWENIVSSLLTKKYFFNLQRMNILLNFQTQSSEKHARPIVDWMVDILKQKKNILKHQFNDLNIGFRCSHLFDKHAAVDKRLACDILEWDSTINDTFLDEFQEQCCEPHQATRKCKINEKIYFTLKNE